MNMKRTIIWAGILFVGIFRSASAQSSVNLSTLTPLPTYTPAPTYTALPTYTFPIPTESPTQIVPTESPTAEKLQIAYVTVTPYLSPTGLVPVALDQEILCGEKMSVKLTYMVPKIQATLSEHFPIGRFLMVYLGMRSLTNDTIGPLKSESFTISGSLYGRSVTIMLDRGNSDYANSRWETPNLNSKIGKNGLETFLIFDVHPEMTNFELVFTPLTENDEEPLCEVRIPLPIQRH